MMLVILQLQAISLSLMVQLPVYLMLLSLTVTTVLNIKETMMELMNVEVVILHQPLLIYKT